MINCIQAKVRLQLTEAFLATSTILDESLLATASR